MVDGELYRDKIATVDKDGSRIWIYPKKPGGKFHNYRSYLSYFLIAFLFAAPFIRINGEQFLMLGIMERKFVFFGMIFWPQDFHLFVFAMLTFIVFILLFTLVFGRLFCGWVCPQTIFMEMLFRKIEYWIEGDYQHQKALDKQKWSKDWILKKTVKNAIFYLLSFLISNVFLAYIISGEELWKIIREPPDQHIAGLSAIMIFSGVFYGVFARLREQVCTTVCPYGRLQGVLLDRDSLVVAYDYKRGEDRSRFKKEQDRTTAGKGDCIDCGQCVNVCPTGIDIRNGTQLECINCTACIDACDFMMEKTGMKKGLIRYASESVIADKIPFHLNKKAKAYTVVLVLLFATFIAVLFSRTDVETTLLRTPGMLYQSLEDGRYSNLYNYKIVNKTNKQLEIHFEIKGMPGEIKLVGEKPIIPGNGTVNGALFVVLEKKQLTGVKTKYKINVYSADREIETITTTFVGPPL